MSQENVERLRAYWQTWGMGAEADLSLFDRDVVFEEAVLPDRDTYRGHEALMRATRKWLAVYESFTFELEQIVGSGDRLVTIHRFRGKGRHSGIEEEGRFAYLWTFRKASVIRFVSYRDPDEALEALGLSE